MNEVAGEGRVTMKRGNFLRFTTGGLVTTALAAPALAQTPPQVSWRLQSSYPRSLETLYGACDFFSRAVSDASDGRFRVQVFAAGEIIPPLQIVDGVQQGTVEMGHTGAYFYMGKDPAFAFGTGIPFGLNSRQANAWFYQGGGIDLLNEFFATFNMFHLPAGNTGTQMGGWFRKEVRSVADLQGLKMRIGGLAGTALQRLGLVPQQLAAGDTYTALERGTLDAVEWVGPADDEKLGFARIAPYYYYPSFWEGNSALSFFINLDKWRALPERWQNVVKTAAMAAATDMQAKYDVLNPSALRRLVAGGTQLRSFPPDVLQASYKAARDLYAELSDKHQNFKRLHDHLIAFRGQSLPWWQISDFSYDALMIQASRQNW
jgi:TRAP-type mannitol/chloroaromatic compound transport system substrate-binding protein